MGYIRKASREVSGGNGSAADGPQNRMALVIKPRHCSPGWTSPGRKSWLMKWDQSTLERDGDSYERLWGHFLKDHFLEWERFWAHHMVL
jgi:hypothetical protein